MAKERRDTASRTTDTIGRLGPDRPFDLVWRQRACGGHCRRTREVAFAEWLDEWSCKRHIDARRLLAIMAALPVVSMLTGQ